AQLVADLHHLLALRLVEVERPQCAAHHAAAHHPAARAVAAAAAHAVAGTVATARARTVATHHAGTVAAHHAGAIAAARRTRTGSGRRRRGGLRERGTCDQHQYRRNRSCERAFHFVLLAKWPKRSTGAFGRAPGFV